MKSVLITGGAGFVGRYLAAALAGKKRNVTVLDDLSCPNSTFDCHQLQHPLIKCLQGSTLDQQLVARLVADHQVVVHFAATVGVEETISHTFTTTQNLIGTLNIAQALGEQHSAIFGSSADVYGAHSHHYAGRPMRETDLFVYEHAAVNRWVYPHVKALEENIIGNSAAKTVSVRFFNTYGPDMDFPAPKRVVPHFIQSVLSGSPLRLSGNGRQVRTLCYIEDTIQGLEKALDYLESPESPDNDCFNLGGDIPVSIYDLAEQVVGLAVEEGLCEKRLPILQEAFNYSQNFDDSWDRIPDISHARSTLGFEPSFSLIEGLQKTLRYYSQID